MKSNKNKKASTIILVTIITAIVTFCLAIFYNKNINLSNIQESKQEKTIEKEEISTIKKVSAETKIDTFRPAQLDNDYDLNEETSVNDELSAIPIYSEDKEVGVLYYGNDKEQYEQMQTAIDTSAIASKDYFVGNVNGNSYFASLNDSGLYEVIILNASSSRELAYIQFYNVIDAKNIQNIIQNLDLAFSVQ